MSTYDTSFNQVIFVEDDPAFRATIAKYLQKKGYKVAAVDCAIEFYREFEKQQYAIAIIDIGLPDQNGLVLSKYVRSNSTSRIILLTGDTALDTRIEGFEAGADIYLTKPVNFRLFDAALGSLMLRVAEHNSILPDTSGINIDKNGYTHIWILRTEDWYLITPCGEKLHLTAKEFTFLHALAETPTVPVSRNTLLARLGYPLDEYGNRSLESLIYRLRKKISPNLETPIKAINGGGYIFTAKIEIEN